MTPAETVERAIRARRAVRAFLSDPVDPALLRRLLELAARAPSGTNMQPWKLRVIGPQSRARLEPALVAALEAGERPGVEEYRYYPAQFREPYLARRRKVGWDLYGLLGVARGDTEGMKRQTAANLRFFGAPVALMLTIDRDLEIGSWLDLGMFIENLLIAAQGHGLDSCPQAIFAQFHTIVRRELAIPEEEVVVCGIAIGRADPDAPANRLVPEREPVENFTTWLD
ncbi:nitroreductase [Bosea thiooxidans]|nr:nitroreductase [Bosea sp. (in: a-proteobacteria)]